MGLHSVDGQNLAFDRNHSPLNAGSTWVNPVRDGNSNNVPQILIGYQKNGFGTNKDYGIKVSKPTKDVRTAGNSDLVMSSAFNMFKIVSTGTLTAYYTASTGSSTTTLNHGLGFVPTFTTYTDVAGAGLLFDPMPYTLYSFVTGALQEYVYGETATGDIFNIQWLVPPGSPLYASNLQFTARYYLTQETAN